MAFSERNKTLEPKAPGGGAVLWMEGAVLGFEQPRVSMRLLKAFTLVLTENMWRQKGDWRVRANQFCIVCSVPYSLFVRSHHSPLPPPTVTSFLSTLSFAWLLFAAGVAALASVFQFLQRWGIWVLSGKLVFLQTSQREQFSFLASFRSVFWLLVTLFMLILR